MRRLTLFTLVLAVVLSPPLAGQSIHPGGPTDGGVRATCDLPKDRHMRNTGGSDGAGLCVPTSCELASRWQGSALDGFQAWCQRRPGGSYPDKLEQSIVQFCREMKREIPKFVQHTGGDESVLDLAMKTGRAVGITYAGVDDFYGDVIAHMVLLAHLDPPDRPNPMAAIIDNNRPGQWIWMTRKQLLDRWRGVDANGRPLTVRSGLRMVPVGGGWCVVLLDSPPPPYSAKPAEFFSKLPAAGSCKCGDRCECGPKCECDEGKVLYGQCPGGRCPTGPVSYPAVYTPAVAQPSADADEYLWVNGQWAKVVKPAPIPEVKKAEAKADPPVGEPKPAEDPKNNFGVDSSKLTPGKWFHNGAEVSREAALAAVAGDALTDDSEKWFLVHVGTAAEQAAFLAAVKQLDPATAAKLHVKAYGAAEWQVGQFSIPTGVSLRKPAVGRIGGEAGRLAGELSADTLKRFVGDSMNPPKPMPAPAPTPDPQPQPTPEPAPGPQPSPIPPTLFGVPTWLLAVGVLAALALYFRRK